LLLVHCLQAALIDFRGRSPYYENVAIQKKSRAKPAANTRKKPAGKSLVYLFWFVFFVVILLLFIINWKTIRNTVNNTGLVDRVTRRTTGALPESPEDTVPAPEEEAPPVSVVIPKPPDGIIDDDAEPASPQSTEPAAPAPEPAASPAPAAEPVKPPESAPRPAEPPKPAADTTTPAPKTVERSIYFIKFDEENGVILRTKVSRTLPVTDSPLLDVLNALLRGPTATEEKQKLRSLIPPETRVLSATVRGSTAYISFSEDFQFNTDGIEGYIAQLQQLVWTITEFSNVNDVQFLIEGRRVDYLGEGIRIGSPLSRSNFQY
jgi:outer membrane biosynthesis protein TonB